MRLYGVFSITHHGWSRVLTVMGEEGRSAALAAIEAGPEIEVRAGEGRLTQYHAQSREVLQELIERHGITVLEPGAWAAKKEELGAAIYR